MRERFRHLVDGVLVSKLNEFSVIGSRFAVYKASHEITPPNIARHRRIVNDTAPAARWAHDLLDRWTLGSARRSSSSLRSCSLSGICVMPSDSQAYTRP
ncbi:hypothetical protein B0H15DRAFT_866224 [Mycena belliarum]|uniref:Uncharacterized protein n=1 Tax=Mycena belliarum TaxID=1033014 RepID=A0AAD6TUI3_9AGAR|nr:hypothetical protein B0H15DRAFT_866224 [Mycena belliae]